MTVIQSITTEGGCNQPFSYLVEAPEGYHIEEVKINGLAQAPDSPTAHQINLVSLDAPTEISVCLIEA
jgi:hypothetical protein